MNHWLPASYKKDGSINKIPQGVINNAILSFQRITNKRLPIILTLGHLAHHTDISYCNLQKFVNRYKYPYRDFKIKKRSGGFRLISVPSNKLLHVQKWINKAILSKAEENPYSFAFTDNKSVKDCAEAHCGCRWLIKIDVRHFFESLSEIKVYDYFHSLGYSNLLSFELARICTKTYRLKSNKYIDEYWKSKRKYKLYKDKRIGHLPQGAPTSPKLANCLVKELDYTIAEYTLEKNIIYTRYADDLIFSTDDENFTMRDAKSVVSYVYRLLPQFGLKPNTQKTNILHPGARKVVLGLLVDSEKVRFTKDFKSNLECHLYYSCKDPIGHASRRGFSSIIGLQNHINGLLSYVKYIDSEYYSKLEKRGLIPTWQI